MPRKGKMAEPKRERIVLHVKCKSVELFIVGAGNKIQTMFEGYAIAGLPAPIEIDKIEKVQKVKITKEEFYEVIEELFTTK